MPPAVIDAMASFRAAIDANDVAQSQRMARAWLEVSRGLDAEFQAVSREVANAAAVGRGVTFWHLSRMERFQSLMVQIISAQRRFATVAATDITQTQTLMARWSVAQNSQLIAMQRPALAGQFDRLPVEAVANMVGHVGDGTPLGDYLRSSFGDEGVRAGYALVRGTALGWHPTKTARVMRDEVNVTLDKSITIARTEQMRVWRETGRQQYIDSRVVEGYRRVASKSIRTCMACLMADGQVYPLSEPFEEHVNGRCTFIPVVFGAPPVVYETGEQWFLRQNEATQRRMMGQGRYEAWQQGRFSLPDLITVQDNATWGKSLQVTPLYVLAARPAANAPQSVPTSPPPPPPYVLQYQASAQQKAIVDQHVLNEIQRYANRHNLPVADVQATVERVLHDIVANVPVSSRFKSVNLPGLRNSGRFLSQFETGTSGGALTPTGRANAEEKGLGFPKNVDPKERPIYGFFNINRSPSGAYFYGDLEFVFKDEVRRRTTFTIGDSLGEFNYNGLYGAPVNAPELGAADSAIDSLMIYARSGNKDQLVNSILYVEAQVQGGVQLTDAEVMYDHQNRLSAADKSWLQSLGIQVR